MSKVTEAFSNGKAFIPFLTAGDPNIEKTENYILELEKAGADLIEIGIPFSDPIAEGVVIQEADLRSLKAGTTTDKIFDMVDDIADKIHVPIVFMTYINPIYVYGVEKFAKRAKACGAAGVIVPDVPFEEKEEIRGSFEAEGMVAPTSADRVRMIAKEAKGFLYCVSSLGVTGVRTEIGTAIGDLIQTVKEECSIPCAIGFGISTPEQAEAMAKISDGAIVGSAIVKIVAKYGKNCIPYVKEYVQSMKQAVERA